MCSLYCVFVLLSITIRPAALHSRPGGVLLYLPFGYQPKASNAKNTVNRPYKAANGMNGRVIINFISSPNISIYVTSSRISANNKTSSLRKAF